MTKKEYSSVLFLALSIYCCALLCCLTGGRATYGSIWGIKLIVIMALVLIPISLAISIILFLILIGISIRFGMSKDDRYIFLVLRKVRRNGFDDKIIAKLTEVHNRLAQDPERFSKTYNTYTLILSGIYGDIEDYEKAFYYLNTIRLNELTRELVSLQSQTNYSGYLATKLILESRTHRFPDAFVTQEMIINQALHYKLQDSGVQLLQLSLAELELASDRPQEALDRMLKTKPKQDSSKLEYYYILYRIYFVLGNKQMAEENLLRAIKLTRDKRVKEMFERKLKELRQIV